MPERDVAELVGRELDHALLLEAEGIRDDFERAPHPDQELGEAAEDDRVADADRRALREVRRHVVRDAERVLLMTLSSVMIIQPVVPAVRSLLRSVLRSTGVVRYASVSGPDPRSRSRRQLERGGVRPRGLRAVRAAGDGADARRVDDARRLAAAPEPAIAAASIATACDFREIAADELIDAVETCDCTSSCRENDVVPISSFGVSDA
jgi:hypothetical protein